MLTHLVKKGNDFVCHNCRMKQKELRDTCWFCGYFFSNFEIIKIENFENT